MGLLNINTNAKIDFRELTRYGGEGSGNFGHLGIPGHHGGSADRDLFNQNKVIHEAKLQVSNSSELKKPIDGLSSNESIALRAYTTNIAWNLNANLWGGSASEDELEVAKNLDSALNKLPKSKGTFYRGIGGKNLQKELLNLSDGGSFLARGFSSFTDTIEGAKIHGSVLLKFTGNVTSI
jgi:hypothetical protein